MQNPVEESKLGISLLVPSGVFEAAGSSHFAASLLCIHFCVSRVSYRGRDTLLIVSTVQWCRKGGGGIRGMEPPRPHNFGALSHDVISHMNNF